MKITVVGIGYVGLSLATLLSQKNNIIALDIDEKKVEMINKKISPINDKDIIKYFKEKSLNLKATTDSESALKDADYVIICTPTNYDNSLKSFDTSSVENIIKQIKKMRISTSIIIKSTVPVGYTESIKKKYNINNIIFSPEFLREGKALYDNLYPSRMIMGDISDEAHEFANLLKSNALKEDIEIKYMNFTEAEAVKLYESKIFL